jgi:glycopeptide antibiotics resistance protein
LGWQHGQMTTRADATGAGGRSILTIALFTIYAVLLVGVILFKFPFKYAETADGRVLNLIPLAGSFDKNGTLRLDELIENVLIFVPFGIYIGMVKPNWSFARRILPIVGTSVAFETIQYIFAIGRADVTDVMTNTLGGLVGIGVYALLSNALKFRAERVINVVALILTVIVFLYSAFLLSRSR